MSVRVGILGGGQLAQMLMLAGLPLGFEFLIYAPASTPSLAGLGEVMIGEYDDVEQLQRFVERVDVVTIEHENLPAACLDYLETTNCLAPSAAALRCAQDRLLEKQLFQHLAIPSNGFYPIDSAADLQQAAEQLGLPLILKARRNGYDGKLQVRVPDEAALQALLSDPTHDWQGWLAEQWVTFESEVSLIAVRARSGAIRYYDLCVNVHEHGILRQTHNDRGELDAALVQQAQQALEKVLQHFDYVGVLTAEFFVQDGQLLANELAPRVHNSGHWTIEGCVSSQFENHLRAVAGLPLGATDSIAACTLFNVISAWPTAREALLELPNACVHDYRKTPRPGRKLGHVTYVVTQQTPATSDIGIAAVTNDLVRLTSLLADTDRT